jgi:hypothetical protein
VRIGPSAYLQGNSNGPNPTQKVKMSKSLIPSRSLLSSFSRCLRTENKSRLSAVQCRNLFSTSTYTVRVGLRGGEMGVRGATRGFSMSSARKYKTVEEQRSRYRSGVCLSLTFFPLHNTSPLYNAIDKLGTSPNQTTSSSSLPNTQLFPFLTPKATLTHPSHSPTAQASSSSSQAPP